MNIDIDLQVETVTPRTRASIGGTGYANTGAILLENFNVMIDSSLYPRTAEVFRKKIEFETSLPTKYLIFTHYHGDHTFGAQSYKDINIISSQSTKENIEHGYHDDWRNWLIEDDPIAKDGIERILPTNTFDTKHTISEGDMEVIISHVGGHTSGSSYVYFPSEQVLYAGDLVFYRCFPYGADPTCDPDKWIEVLKELQGIDARMVIPGHGPIFGSTSELYDLISLMEDMRKLILEELENDDLPTMTDLPEDYSLGSENRMEITFENWKEFYLKKDAENKS